MSEEMKNEKSKDENAERLVNKQEPKEIKHKDKINWLEVTRNILVIAFVAFLVNAPSLYMLKKSQVKVGVVDVQALLVEHEKKVTQALFANQNMYEQADSPMNGVVEQQTKIFVKTLESTIEQINKDCNCVLINKAALLTQSGKVTDYTQQVREALEK